MPKRKGIWVKRGAGLAAGVLVLAALVWAFLPKPLPIETAVIARGPFEQAVLADGKTRVRARYVVSTPVSGTLMRQELKAGDPVRRGMLLATVVPAALPLLDPRSEREARERVGAAEATQARAEAAVEGARASLELAQSDYGRMARLLQNGSVAAVEVERAEATLRIRRKELEGAQFEADAARHDVEQARAAFQHISGGASLQSGAARRWEIRSATDGRVLRVFQEYETVIAAGTPLIEVADPRSLEIVVDVLSVEAVQIRLGAPARIERWGGSESLSARVRQVEPAAFTKVSALGVEEQRVNVILDLLSPPDLWSALGDGYRVEAEIVVFAAADVLSVPISALVRQEEHWAVYVVREGRAQVRRIELGPRNPSAALVQQGLAAGETVVLYPGDQIRDGVRVTSR